MVSIIIAYRSPERSGPVVQPKAGKQGPEGEVGPNPNCSATAERGGDKAERVAWGLSKILLLFPFSVVGFLEFPDFIWGEIVDAPRFRLSMLTLGQMDTS